MHSEVHIRIAKALFRKLNLPMEYEKILIDAIVEPDEWRRKRPGRKHHYPSYSTLSYIKNARNYYIKGNIPSCLWNLGIALHFIQDACIPSPGKYRRELHLLIEGKIKFIRVPEEEVDLGFSPRQSSLEFVKKVISNVRWTYDPKSALLNATRASAKIAAAVLSPKDPPSELPAKYRTAKGKHNKQVLGASAISMLSFVIGCILGFPSSSILISWLFITFLAFIILVGGDAEFYRLKEEAEWYGIK